MQETENHHRVFTLLEITESIGRAFQRWYPSSYWIKAEMNKLNFYPHSGHCYPDLVERREGKVVAQIRANIWSSEYSRINERFIQVLREPLRDGINILFLGRLSFSPVYGVSLVITDIDPSYTLGDLEREKLETIDRLKIEGIFGRNRSLPFPLLPQRIAVISVETSRGYSDFRSMIDGNPWGYKYFYMLFPALLQGEKAVDSVIFQLEEIRKVLHHFDVVAIIRGGGGEVGLAGYNHYRLASCVALFPIPVITGIGHATNETVTEMIAWKNAITPTELADFLIQKFHNFSVPVKNGEASIRDYAGQLLQQEKNRLPGIARYFKTVAVNSLNMSRTAFVRRSFGFRQAALQSTFRQDAAIGTIKEALKNSVHQQFHFHFAVVDGKVQGLSRAGKAFLKEKSALLGTVSKQADMLHPSNVLKRGYSITRCGGKAITGITGISEGDIIETTLHKGTIVSKVQKTSKQ